MLNDHQIDHVYRALETASEGISLLDEYGKFVYVNDAYAEIYRYEPNEMIGLHWEALYPEGMTDEIYDDVLPTLQEEGDWSGETIGRRSDGTEIVEDHYLATTDDGGMVCVVRDVTEQRHLQQELDEIHGRITDAFIGLDRNWRFTHVNERAAELLDATDAELSGTGFCDAFPGDTTVFEEAFREAMDTQEPISMEETVPSLGVRLAVDVYPSRTGLSVYARDVTEEYEQRRRLAEQEQTLREIYDVISDGERSLDSRLEALLGICQGVLGTDYAALSYIDGDEYRFEVVRAVDDSVQAGDTAPLSATNCERVIETEETLVLADVEREAPDLAARAGNAEWGISCYLGAPVIVNDDVYGTFCFYDTETREEPFTDWEVTLVDLLSRWVSYELEREEQNRRLEESNERLEQFAYAASHDLQEPLRMVSSYLQLVDQRYADQLDADGQEFIQYAVDGAERMRDMIEGLLAYSRVESKGDTLEPLDLNDVAADALADLEVRIEESEAEVSVDELPRVLGDRSQLRQVFQNLIDNAIEYSEDQPRIDITAERHGEEWAISVSDEGIGIESADADRVFTVFERLHTESEHAGTGIGLALCQRVAERHGGDIWVESEPGEGSTFTFTLRAVSGQE